METTTTSSATTDTETVSTTSDVTVDNTATKEQVAELYIATFGRAPDSAGLDYWTNEVVTGNLTLDGVAESFFDQEEAQTMYGNSSNEDFVISVYENALGRTVDASDAGVQYWVGELEADKYSKDGFIKTVLDGAKAESSDTPEDALLLQNRVHTGLLYAEEIGVADSPLAKQVMEKVTHDESTAEDAMGTISYYKDWVSKYDTALGDAVDTDELYSHIDDDDYWTELEQTHELHFDAEPTVKFWEQDDSLWENSVSLDENATFDFLDNKEAWADSSEYQSFHSGEFAHIDTESIFGKYGQDNAKGETLGEHSTDEFSYDVDGMFKDQDEKGYGAHGDADSKEENGLETSDSSSDDESESDDYEVEHTTDDFVDGSSFGYLGGVLYNEQHSNDYTYSENEDSETEASTDVDVSGVVTTDASVDANIA